MWVCHSHEIQDPDNKRKIFWIPIEVYIHDKMLCRISDCRFLSTIGLPGITFTQRCWVGRQTSQWSQDDIGNKPHPIWVRRMSNAMVVKIFVWQHWKERQDWPPNKGWFMRTSHAKWDGCCNLQTKFLGVQIYEHMYWCIWTYRWNPQTTHLVESHLGALSPR